MLYVPIYRSPNGESALFIKNTTILVQKCSRKDGVPIFNIDFTM